MKKLVVLMAFLAGCTSIQTRAVSQLDAIITDPALNIQPTDTPEIVVQKKRLIEAAETSRQSVIDSEERAASAERWASVGKWTVGIIVGVVVLIVLFVALKVLGKIPFL